MFFFILEDSPGHLRLILSLATGRVMCTPSHTGQECCFCVAWTAKHGCV